EFLQEHAGVDDHTVGDDRDHVGGQDARRQQVERILLVADDHRVTSVVTTLVAHYVVHLVADQVGRLALAFIAPLGAHARDRRHWSLPFRSTPGRGFFDPEHGWAPGARQRQGPLRLERTRPSRPGWVAVKSLFPRPGPGPRCSLARPSAVEGLVGLAAGLTQERGT